MHRILVSFARPIHVQVWNEYIHSSEHTNCLNGAQAYYSGRCPTSITATVLCQPRCSCRYTAGMERCLPGPRADFERHTNFRQFFFRA